MTNCGPGGSGNESCCTSLPVAGGTFYRFYGSGGLYPPDGGWPNLAGPATVSSFRLDKYLVTVGRFRQFVKAWKSGWRPAAGSGKHAHLNGGKGLANSGSPGTYETGWLASDDDQIAPTSTNLGTSSSPTEYEHGPYTWTDTAGSQENLPIDSVNWYEAYAFCIWDGGFLPSVTEWEYAAAGGSEQRVFPWGSTLPGDMNQYAIYGCSYPNPRKGPCTNSTSNIAPVGTAAQGAGLWGQLDLMGEVWEWELDVHVLDFEPYMDSANLSTSGTQGGDVRREARGGGYDWPVTFLLPPINPDYFPPEYRHAGGAIGFRCARMP